MTSYLDLDSWPRKETFHFFKGFQNPFFSVTVEIDVTDLRAATRLRDSLSFTAAVHYCSIRAANDIPEFRYRLRDERVLVHDRVHGGTTVLVEDERFVFCYFRYEEHYERFQDGMLGAVTQARTGETLFDPSKERDDLIYHTSIPWITFTGLVHSHSSSSDSVPQIAFGKYEERVGQTLLPVSIGAHHALVDGIHVGRFVERMRALLSSPEDWL